MQNIRDSLARMFGVLYPVLQKMQEALSPVTKEIKCQLRKAWAAIAPALNTACRQALCLGMIWTLAVLDGVWANLSLCFRATSLASYWTVRWTFLRAKCITVGWWCICVFTARLAMLVSVVLVWYCVLMPFGHLVYNTLYNDSGSNIATWIAWVVLLWLVLCVCGFT